MNVCTITKLNERAISLSSPKIDIRKMWILLLSLFLFFSILSIFQIFTITNKSFIAAEYERKIEKLSSEEEILELAFLKNNSLEGKEDLIRGLNFEEVEEIHYIKTGQEYIVRKNISR